VTLTIAPVVAFVIVVVSNSSNSEHSKYTHTHTNVYMLRVCVCGITKVTLHERTHKERLLTAWAATRVAKT